LTNACSVQPIRRSADCASYRIIITLNRPKRCKSLFRMLANHDPQTLPSFAVDSLTRESFQHVPNGPLTLWQPCQCARTTTKRGCRPILLWDPSAIDIGSPRGRGTVTKYSRTNASTSSSPFRGPPRPFLGADPSAIGIRSNGRPDAVSPVPKTRGATCLSQALIVSESLARPSNETNGQVDQFSLLLDLPSPGCASRISK
jgi:hypothetical protein